MIPLRKSSVTDAGRDEGSVLLAFMIAHPSLIVSSHQEIRNAIFFAGGVFKTLFPGGAATIKNYTI
jgi:hypothetical protein